MSERIPVLYIHNGNQKEMFASIDVIKEIPKIQLWESLKSLWAKFSFDVKKTMVTKAEQQNGLEIIAPEKKFFIVFKDEMNFNKFFNKITNSSLVYKDSESIASLNYQMDVSWPFKKGQIY